MKTNNKSNQINLNFMVLNACIKKKKLIMFVLIYYSRKVEFERKRDHLLSGT